MVDYGKTMVRDEEGTPYSLDDLKIQILNYGKAYDYEKYGTKKDPYYNNMYNKLRSIMIQYPNGERMMKHIEYDVDADRGAVPKRKGLKSWDTDGMIRKYIGK